MSGAWASVAGRVRRWWVPFALAAVVRGAYWALVTPDWLPDKDADQYLRIARTIADGQGFSLIFPQLEMHATAFRPPLYPYLLTPGVLVFGDAIWPARLLSLVIGSLVAVLAGALAARIGGRTAGLAAAVAVACYPPLLANDTITLTEPLALLLLLGAVLLVDEERWAWGGVAVGALLLTRPNGYLVVAVLAAWLALRLGWRRGLAFVGVVLLVFAPWLVRNRIQVGTWRPTTSDGVTIAGIYAPPAQAAGTFVDPVFAPEYGNLEDRLAQFDEAGWNEKLTREGLDALKGNPGYVGTVLERNVRGYFELDPELNRWPEVGDGRSWRFRQAALPLFYVVTIGGLVGLWRHRRDPRTIVLAILVAQFVALSLLLVAPPRLRAPFDLAMCIGAGLLAADLLARWGARRAPQAVSPSATPAG